MTSQTDLDQGGTARQWLKTYLGPTVGWLMFQLSNVLTVNTGGTTTVGQGTTLVAVNVAAVVTIQLPTAIAGNGIPTTFLGLPVTIVDIGGNAETYNITILPFGSELIMGLASLTISVNYGGYTLVPNTTAGGWNQQP